MKLLLAQEPLPPLQSPTPAGLAPHKDLARELAFAGDSSPMRLLRMQIQTMGKHLRTALLEIESGLGEEAIVAEIARQSSNRPLTRLEPTAVNCAAAKRGLEGLRQLLTMVQGRAVYLGEIHLLSREAQHAVTELLADNSAGRPSLWIAGTRVPLKTLRHQGALLPDLLQRLAAVILRVPPLRDRPEDLPELSALLLASLAAESGVPPPNISAQALEPLRAHPWQENTTELHAVLRACVLQPDGKVSGKTINANRIRAVLSSGIARSGSARSGSAPTPMAADEPAADLPVRFQDVPVRLQDVTDRHLVAILRRCNGNKFRAAEMLGISRSTLYRMLEAIAHPERQVQPASNTAVPQ